MTVPPAVATLPIHVTLAWNEPSFDRSDMATATAFQPDTRRPSQGVAVEVRSTDLSAALRDTETPTRDGVTWAAGSIQPKDGARQRATLERELASRVESARRRATVEHATLVATLEARAEGKIAAARRAAEVALQAQETDLEEQAARQVESAVRAEQVEAARILVKTMKQHDAIVARTRAEARAEVARVQDQLRELRSQAVNHAENPTEPVEQNVPAWMHVHSARSRPRVPQLRPSLVELAGVVALAGLTGTLVGWLVSLSGLV